MDKLGIAYPKARVIHRPAQAEAASRRPPLAHRRQAQHRRLRRRRQALRRPLAARSRHRAEPGSAQTPSSSASTPPRSCRSSSPPQDAHIVRVEVLNGKYLYAIKVHITGETFDLCPADICRTTSGTDLNRAACAIDAPKSGITVEAYTPPADAIRDVETIMQHSGIDIGGVEYITDSRDGQRYYYDTNALSNFVADGPNVIGFDPFAKLVDWLKSKPNARLSLHTASLQNTSVACYPMSLASTFSEAGYDHRLASSIRLADRVSATRSMYQAFARHCERSVVLLLHRGDLIAFWSRMLPMLGT